MIFSRSKQVFALFAAALSLAAAPAQANTAASATSAAVGAIDVSKVAAEAQAGEDGQFQQLFARWESLDKPAATPLQPTFSSVSVPSLNPLEGARMSSGYGMRTHPVLGGRRGHAGIDLAAPTGTPIYATADGTVSKAAPFSSYGNFVSIEHGGKLQTRYAHMSRIAVASGARVKKGDIIGYVGSTGRSTGPHLHYEVRVAGQAVNPTPYMMGSPVQGSLALASN